MNLESFSVEHLPEAVVWLTPEARVFQANQAAHRLLGYEDDALTGVRLDELDRSPVGEHLSLLCQAGKRGGAARLETTWRTRQGADVAVDVTAASLRFEGNDYEVVVLHDITRRKVAEKALERRIETLTRPMGDARDLKFEDLFDLEEVQGIQDAFAAATGVASIITTPDGRPLTRPSNFCRLCMDIVRKSEKGVLNCYKSDALIGRKNLEGPVIQACLSGGLYDAGSSICVGDGEHIANWLIGQVLDETADLEGMRRYGRDIGADPEQYACALAEVTRMPREQFEGISRFLFLMARQLSQLAYKNVLQAREIEEGVRIRTAELRRANEELEEALHKVKATQEQLVARERLASLGALTAGIAHEIKNPLNFVINFAELSTDQIQELKDNMGDVGGSVDPMLLENIGDILATLELNSKKINEHGKRADSIVRNMLLHSGSKGGEWQAVDLNTMVEEYTNLACHGMQAADPSFRVEIRKAMDERTGMVDLLPADFCRALLNVLTNGLYAADEARRSGLREAAELLVATRSLGDSVEVRIRDNGTGISAAAREKMFTPFFTTKPTGVGTGLGLSIAHNIVVQLHRGEIRVDTEEGAFTEVILAIPRRNPAR